MKDPLFMSKEEFRVFVEERVKEKLNMSLTDFQVALEDGRLDPHSPEVAPLVTLVTGNQNPIKITDG